MYENEPAKSSPPLEECRAHGFDLRLRGERHFSAMTDSSLIADLIRGGVDPDLVQRVAMAIIEAKGTAQVAILKDESAERRRATDRERKRRYHAGRNWHQLRRFVFERDFHRCVYCGGDGNGKSLHCDHVLAISKGGGNTVDNLVSACQRCNSSKRDRPVSAWRASRP